MTARSTALRGAAGAGLGTVAALLVLPSWAPRLVVSLQGGQPPAFWELSRAMGSVAFVLLWLSVLLGLGITARWVRRWPGSARAVDLHRHGSILALMFASAHAVVLLGDRFVRFSAIELLLPFAVPHAAWLAIGAGQVALYLLAIVLGSFYVRRAIGQRFWRALHFATFAVFSLAVVHGAFAGTDRGSWRAVYGLAAGSVLSMTVYRLVRRVEQVRA
jgi:predicted ferric reductase